MDTQNIIIRVATPEDKSYATTITDEMESSVKARGTGIAKRSPEYVAQKIDEGKAVIAVTNEREWVGFLLYRNLGRRICGKFRSHCSAQL